MDLFLSIGLDALSYVLTLLLVTLGLVIIYGMMNVINMAHGELFLLGAYTVVALQAVGVPFWVGFVAAPLVVGIAGLLIEQIVIRHVYGRPIDTILATWACRLRSSRPSSSCSDLRRSAWPTRSPDRLPSPGSITRPTVW